MLADVLDDMTALKEEGHRLLVHCHGRAPRTGLVPRAWLMRTEGMTPSEATAHVAERWPHLGLWNASFTAALDRLDLYQGRHCPEQRLTLLPCGRNDDRPNLQDPSLLTSGHRGTRSRLAA